MKNKKLPIPAPLLIPFLLFVLLWSCQKPGERREKLMLQAPAVARLSDRSANAANPYLTKNHLGQPVLCWTEELSPEAGFVLKYAIFDPELAGFGEVVTVAPSQGTAAHPENMNKLGFRSDGTVLAVFSKKHPTGENRFAGSLYYTQSTDGGSGWTAPARLHSDSARNVGRGYFDLATLPDGEVGAIWLDGRHGREMKGSALYFAKTEGHLGFGQDKVVGAGTCECCRTDLYVDPEGRLHMAYRDILNDSIRDIVHRYSTDNGATFSEARRISLDNWVIHGCPHTGPSLASTAEGLHAVWFTAAGNPGVYLTATGNKEGAFSPRSKISDHARHPQLAALPGDRLILAWDEPGRAETHHVAAGMHGGAHNNAGTGSRIKVQVRKSGRILETFSLSDAEAVASFPVLMPMSDGKTLVAWAQEERGKSGVYYTWLDLGGSD